MTTAKASKKKQKALEYFVRQLLSSKAGRNISRIVLFGSLAQGKADKYSDIDVLLFTPEPQRVRNGIWDASVETYRKYEESVEPLVYHLKKYEQPDSYFLYRSIQEGKQLYP